MATILELPDRLETAAQALCRRNGALGEALRSKILKSFRVVEREGFPLIREIDAAMKQAVCLAAEAEELSGTCAERVEATARLLVQVQALMECYQDILAPMSPPPQ